MIPADQPLPYFTISPNMQGRVAAKDVLAELTVDWLAAQPDSQLSDFVNGLLQAGATLLRKYPPDRGAARRRRFTELFQIEAKRRIVLPAFVDEKRVLTNVTATDNVSPVKSTMANLLDRLNKATSQRGMKSKLAKVMGVPLANVSQWLSGVREPGGETTLRLLQWVEHHEGKQESPGRVSARPEPKTQLQRSSHENQSQARKKR